MIYRVEDTGRKEGRKEKMGVSNDALSTFYLWAWVKNHSAQEERRKELGVFNDTFNTFYFWI